jgi:glycosyltransferase involved in cell wall biosynthesis
MVTVKTTRPSSQGRILIIVQNLSVPFDRRVWLEACALRDAGFDVSVVCPRGTGESSDEVLDGIRIRRYPPPPPTQGTFSYLYEFVYCWLRTARLVVRASRAEGFDVIQACNPPDTFWALALPFKLAGKKFVFDQHDLCPEVYESRFPDGPRFFARALRLLERATYATADHVIATNDSYRDTALKRGNVRPADVTVVRTGPDPNRLRRADGNPAWRQGRRYLCAYLGVMGPQDGVDLALQAIAELARTGRDDIQFVFMGKGDSTDELVGLAGELEVADRVTFTGRVSDEVVFEVLSTADIGLCPDPLNPLNDVSTMNKTMEYMAFELPVVAFDLKETRVSAGEAAHYAEPNDASSYARAIAMLLDDPSRREEMGRLGRTRVEEVLAWEYQAPSYVMALDRLCAESGRAASRRSAKLVRRGSS